MQTVAEDPSSQGDDGDFLAPGSASALEQEGHLFPLGAFAHRAPSPTGQMAGHQELLEARRGSAPGFAQALAELGFLVSRKPIFQRRNDIRALLGMTTARVNLSPSVSMEHPGLRRLRNRAPDTLSQGRLDLIPSCAQ
jgi:hypothetical protein